MQNRVQESKFTRFYLWMIEAKVIMGLFFVYFVFMYLLLGLISSGPVVGLDFFTAVQMVFACFFIGLEQQLLLPGDKISKTRGMLWVLLGTLTALVFSLVFRWFAAFPLWCWVVFLFFACIGMGAMLYRNQLKLKRETWRLNQQLEQFKKQQK